MGKTFEAPGGGIIIGSFKETKITDCVTSMTKDVFPAIWINDTFVQNPASTWESELYFNASLARVHVLGVVNDSAERGIAFIE